MTHPLDRPERSSALTPVPVSGPPGLFEAWDATLYERSFELWSTYAGRSGSRTERLLKRELGQDVAIPPAATVRAWAMRDGWAARADTDLARSHGKAVRELQIGWLAALRLSQQTLLDGMAGAFDDLPHGGAGRIKAAEVTLRVIERAGLLALLPESSEVQSEDEAPLSLDERRRRAREKLLELNQEGS